MIIQTQSELDAACAKLTENPYLTIDTEFLRDKTYFSKLCLIQMAGPGVEPIAVDPIAHDLDLTPLWNLMANKNVLKVFHAARQDMEIFFFEMDALPHPIFDTQVAAMVCGHGDQIAYNALVRNITGQQIEKTAQFTDWSRRPLTDKQLNYALADVTHLRDVYESLSAELKSKNREHWVTEEMDILTNPDTYDLKPEEMWRRIKIRSDKPDVMAILQALAAWREEDARERDVPRGRILKDETLADLAMYKPTSVDGLFRVRSLPNDLAKGKVGKKLLEIIERAKKTPKDQMPRKIVREPMPKSAQGTLEMLKLLLKINCNEHNVATRLVAGKDDLEALAMENNPDISALKGWRREVFGEEALALKSGRLALSIKQGNIVKTQI
ncbi:MAG: ribonuclease D [Pseudomonadota bacterium]